ncbi:MAG: hypothetical protein PHP86_12390 [Nevskiales bacterium]|nr:hypothetical protein [Nevskiales bacterium]
MSGGLRSGLRVLALLLGGCCGAVFAQQEPVAVEDTPATAPVPSYCKGSWQNPENPLALAQLGEPARTWLESRSAEHFGSYLFAVRERYRAAQPLPQCRAGDTACRQAADWVADYTAALDRLFAGGGAAISLSDFRNVYRTPLDGPPSARVAIVDPAHGINIDFSVDCDTDDPAAYERNHPEQTGILYANELISQYVTVDQWAALAAAAQANAALYQSLLDDGLAMWPWELWLNGLAASPDVSRPPPAWQWVALRPSIGLDLSYPRQADADSASNRSVSSAMRARAPTATRAGGGLRHW